LIGAPEFTSPETTAAIGAWPSAVVTDINRVIAQLLKDARKLLVKDLVEDVRKTLSPDDNYCATPDGLEKAPSWKVLIKLFCETASLLAAFADRFVRDEYRSLVVQEELDSCRKQILQENIYSIASHMEMVLSQRWQIGADSSREILAKKLNEALERASVRVPLELVLRASEHEPAVGEQFASAPRADEEQVRLGKAAAQYNENLITMSHGNYRTEQRLRKEYPQLEIWLAIDESKSLSPFTRSDFFEKSVRVYKQEERFRFIGEILGVPGATLYDCYKQYRKTYGLQRRRSSKRCAV
jgi:hypothetical protein